MIIKERKKSIGMKAEIFKPSPALAPFIENYMIVDIDWRQTPEKSSIWRLIPFGQVSMLFLLGDAHGYNLTGPEETMRETQNAFMVGQFTKPIWLKFSGHTHLIKIQFKPSGIQQLIPVDMKEFTNVPSIELEALWGNSVNFLIEQLYNTKSDVAKINILDQYLEHKLLPQNPQADYIDFTIEQLKINKGNLNVGALENKLGISSRHLERLFLKRVGLSPKELSKIIRLNYAFSYLKTAPDQTLTNLSYEAGYYDQSHFSRDFKTITGISPSKLVSHKSSELFVTHGKCFVK